MAEELDIDDFLNHKARSGGGAFLSKWKKDKTVDTWLHTKRMPMALWRHGFPRLTTVENKQTKERLVVLWGGNYNCHEDESVIKNAWKRNEDGSRELPANYCPFCRFLDVVREMVADGKLKWTQPLFKFVPDDTDKKQIIHAGGLYNAFGSDKLSDAQLKEMTDAKIFKKDAWKENAQAKLSYVMCVVDNNNVSAGVQIAIETSLLGEKVKDVINKSRKEFGADKGNPFVNPYAIQWEHIPDAKEFNKKYDATRMSSIPLTPAIAALIRGPAPDLTRVVAPFDIQEMRAYFERYCLVKNMPWDHIFDVRTREQPEQTEAQERPAPKDEAKRAPTPPPSAPSDADDDLVECDNEACKAVMKETDPKCLKCGKVYIEEPKTPPPPPPMRKRGAAAAAAAKAPPPPPSSHAASEQEELDDDSIPF